MFNLKHSCDITKFNSPNLKCANVCFLLVTATIVILVIQCSILAGVQCVPSLDARLFNLANYDSNSLVLLSSYVYMQSALQWLFASYGHMVFLIILITICSCSYF